FCREAFYVALVCMSHRVRHCVECPNCRTRYLIAFSPYRNGSYLARTGSSISEHYTLYCRCGIPAVCSQWHWSELNTYKVSSKAHDRGYGTPDEIVAIEDKTAVRKATGESHRFDSAGQ